MNAEHSLIVPSHNIEAEQSVLGGLMLNPKAWDDISDRVAEHDFYRAEHKLIYRHIGRLVESGADVDVITVAESIERTGKLDKVGGLAYLGSLVHSTPSAANIRTYADIVRRSWKEREFQSMIFELQSTAESELSINEKIENAVNLLTAIADDSKKDAQTLSEAALNAMETLEHRYECGGDVHGLKTHLIDFDRKTGGLHPGDLIIVAGRPSSGKTAFATNIGENVAILEGKSVLMFSLEMSPEQLATRAIASAGSVNLNVMRSAKLQEDDWSRLSAAVGKISDAKFRIDPNTGISASQMHSRARRIQRKHGLDLIIVDYLQLMADGGDTRNNELAAITRKFKLMAKDLNVPVICLSQLSRKVEERANKRPMMSDLRDSGAIEQDGDVIVMLYRDEYYNPDSPNKGIAEAIIAKQRMGETGTVLLTFQGEYSRFSNFSGVYQHETKTTRRGFDADYD